MTTNAQTQSQSSTQPGRHIEPSAPRGLVHQAASWWATRKRTRVQERAEAAYRSRKAAEIGS